MNLTRSTVVRHRLDCAHKLILLAWNRERRIMSLSGIKIAI
jgi:hypothetical protein